jgi:surface polysaccharide O-acyltransferase-like enzyme
MDRKNGIDLFRLIGSLFIMTLHTSLGNLNIEFVENLRLLARWAVPFYFMSSGYFIGAKIVDQKLDFKKIERNVSVLISILVVTFIIYLPISGSDYGIESLLVGNHYHLWFVGSLLFGYVFIWYLYYIKRSKFLPFISFLILFYSLVSGSYDVFFGVSFNFILSRFLISIPFMYLGIIMYKNTFYLRYNKLLVAIAIFGLILQAMEAQYFKLFFNVNIYNVELTLGTIIASISLFALCSSINLKESQLTRWGKEHSLFIYLYHPFLYFLMVIFCKNIFPEKLNTIFMFFPIIGFVIALCTAILLSKYLSNIYKILNGNIR